MVGGVHCLRGTVESTLIFPSISRWGCVVVVYVRKKEVVGKIGLSDFVKRWMVPSWMAALVNLRRLIGTAIIIPVSSIVGIAQVFAL